MPRKIDLDPAGMKATLNNTNDVGFRIEMQIHDGRVVHLEVRDRDTEESVLARDLTGWPAPWVSDVTGAEVATLITNLCAKTEGKGW